ncbi:hypothetical protein NFJ02_06g127050 [Pycnococcus provasolii]
MASPRRGGGAPRWRWSARSASRLARARPTGLACSASSSPQTSRGLINIGDQPQKTWHNIRRQRKGVRFDDGRRRRRYLDHVATPCDARGVALDNMRQSVSPTTSIGGVRAAGRTLEARRLNEEILMRELDLQLQYLPTGLKK